MFLKFRLSKNDRKERGLGVHDFPSKLFCPTVPKHFVRDHSALCFRKIPVAKNLCLTGMITIFHQKLSCLAVSKFFDLEPFRAVFQKIPGN